MEEKVSIGKKVAWASRGISLAINVVLMGTLTYYCTDVIGLGAGLVGTLLLASKVFDGITDLIVGLIIDRTNTRWGKARPYQAFILPCWLITIFLFFVPNIGVTGKCIYIFCLYTLVNSVCATFLNGSDALALARCFKEQRTRVTMTTWNGVLVMVACIIFSIAMPQLIVYMGADRMRWLFVIAVISVVLGIFGMARFVFCKEVVDDKQLEEEAKAEPVPIGASIKALFQNKYIIMMTIFILLYNLSSNLFTAASTYYFKYIVGNVGLASYVGAASIITPIGIMLYPAIVKKIGTVGFLKGGFAVSLIGYVIRMLGGTNMVTMMLGTVLALLGGISCSCFVNIYVVDCMVYGEWKTGKKIDGLVSAITAFGNKIGTAFASGIVGLLMGMTGYDGALEVQSDAANTAIIACFNYIPLLIAVIMFVMALFYNIHRDLPTAKKALGLTE